VHAHVRNPKQRVELQQKPQRSRAAGAEQVAVLVSESREAGLCLALHPAPLATQLVFGGESFARTVRHEHRRLGAMPRLATGTLTAWMERCSSTTRERRRLLFNRCLRHSTTAVRSLRSERRLERG